ncbi:MAG: TatD family hydrolase [Muribaculaceae bacterium]|nr:TatD family hydrolase [Muribaculaceae bacterium]
MIDTHTHLYLPDYGDDKCAVVDRALSCGVSMMVLPGVDADSIAPIKELHELRPDATAMCAGLHPTEIKPETWREHFEKIEAELRSSGDSYVAVGEMGLDLYWEQDKLTLQMEAAEAQLDLADELNLPAVIHCREAMPQMLDLMRARKGRLPNLVFHCYSGSADDVSRLRTLEPDVKFGIGGVVTFKKSPLPEILPLIGVDHILLETDAPWLAPVPMRGKQNESAYIPYIATKVAQELRMTVDEIDLRTSEAARTFFRL